MLRYLVNVFFYKKKIIWESYLGRWKEADTMNENDDLTPYNMPILKTRDYNYDNVFTILESKRILGEPSLDDLGALLCNCCKEVDTLRHNISIGYYANSGQYAFGNNNIHSEDLANLESVILESLPANMDNMDFILSSPGGSIENALLLIKKIRDHTKQLSFLLCGSTYSAATLMAFSGDEIIMQSFSHLSPINPKLNNIDTYVGKQLYKTYKLYSILAPWSIKHLPENHIADNGVTSKTIEHVERVVYNAAINWLSIYLFKIDQLPLFNKIKAKIKINKIVNFFFRFENHHTHVMPFFPQEILAVGLPIKQADKPLDDILRKIRNICDEITTRNWHNEESSFRVRKIYFSSEKWLVLHVNTDI